MKPSRHHVNGEARLRILHACEFFAPSVGGAQEVVRQISSRLVEEGHHVTVATTVDSRRSESVVGGVEVVGFDVSGNFARGMRGDVEAYRRFVLEGDFDVVMTYAAQQWTTDALLPVLDQVQAATVLAPCGFSGLGSPRYAKYFECLPEFLRAFDALILHSSSYRDARFIARSGIPFDIVPNAADEREFGDPPSSGGIRERMGLSPSQPLILSVGGHTGMKGHAEAMAMVRRSSAARRSAAVLVINGNTPARLGCRRSCGVRAFGTRIVAPSVSVRLVDLPREELVEAFFAADLLVHASRVECSPLVLFEAAAAGLPFLSVDVGNAAEIAEWTGGGIVVPWAPGGSFPMEQMIAAMDGLIEDRSLRDDLGRSGRRAWGSRFTWTDVAKSYEAVYRTALESKARRGGREQARC